MNDDEKSREAALRPDPQAFQKAMRKVAKEGRPDVASRAVETEAMETRDAEADGAAPPSFRPPGKVPAASPEEDVRSDQNRR